MKLQNNILNFIKNNTNRLNQTINSFRIKIIIIINSNIHKKIFLKKFT